MALLTPNKTYVINGVTVNEKIIPDGTRWKDAAKAKKAGFSANALYKKQRKLSGGTGKPKSVTIHNTDDLNNVHDDGEQYTRATYSENMNSVRIHYYVDDVCAWQNLKAGTGMSPNDPVGSAEVSWHAGDGSAADGGNMTSLSMEVIMNDNAAHDLKAKDNAARIAAWLLWKHGLDLDCLVTHTYWVNKSAGKKFTDVDEQCCSMVAGKKWCPTYIFASQDKKTALKNWKAFKKDVEGYLAALGRTSAKDKPVEVPTATTAADTEKVIWDFLISKGFNAYAAAGIMGNLYAESGLIPKNLENTYEKKLGYSDDQYVIAVDSGKYKNFVRDAAGFGLAQWTYWSRKQKLLDYAKSKGKSIGDLMMQLEFLYKEFSESFKNVLTELKAAKSVRAASDIMFLKYECPAKQDESVMKKRAEYSQKYYDKYAPKTSAEGNKNTQAGNLSEAEQNGSVGKISLSVGDIVMYNGNVHYAGSSSEKAVPCKPGKAKVTAVAKNAKHPYHLQKTSDSSSTVYGWVDAEHIGSVAIEPYKVKVNADALNIRKGAGSNYAVAGVIKDKGVYTIIEEAFGEGAAKWGLLKSKAGWISLDYTRKL